MARRKRARDDDLRLSQLDIVINEPFGWPGPLRLTSDPSPLPTAAGWTFMAAVTLYGAVASAADGDAGSAVGMAVVTVIFGLLAWRFAREGVWVDADGLTARDLFGSKRVPWSDVRDVIAAGGGSHGRSHTWVERADETLVLLPHLTSKASAVGDAGLRVDLQVLACWWRTGQKRAAIS